MDVVILVLILISLEFQVKMIETDKEISILGKWDDGEVTDHQDVLRKLISKGPNKVLKYEKITHV